MFVKTKTHKEKVKLTPFWRHEWTYKHVYKTQYDFRSKSSMLVSYSLKLTSTEFIKLVLFLKTWRNVSTNLQVFYYLLTNFISNPIPKRFVIFTILQFFLQKIRRQSLTEKIDIISLIDDEDFWLSPIKTITIKSTDLFCVDVELLFNQIGNTHPQWTDSLNVM